MSAPKYKTRASTPAHLELIGNGSGEPFIGVHAVPGRLPQILRLPGESAQSFCTRCLNLLDGAGGCWAMLMYARESGTAQ